MNQLIGITRPTPLLWRLLLLIGGDGLVFCLFVLLGRGNHRLPLNDLGAMLFTAAPFIIGWFAIAPWFGLFNETVNRSWSKLLPRFFIAWGLLGGPLSLALWALFRGRAIPDGIIPGFATVTMIITTLLLLVWRVAYSWWLKRASD
jgi:hypothetical protein